MMKSVKTFFLLCLIVIAASPVWAQTRQRVRSARQSGCATCSLSQTSGAVQTLTGVEAGHLLFMREEEKLARDVYTTLSSAWNLRIFSNIAASEQRHFDAIGTLIERYSLADPAQSDVGAFTDPELKTLYGELIAKGSLSLLDALQVGAAIEDKDIGDLKAAIAATDNRDVLTVYGNLLNGSLSHLSAFDTLIEAIGAN